MAVLEYVSALFVTGEAITVDKWQPPPDDVPSPAGPDELPPSEPELPAEAPEGVPPGPSEMPPAPPAEVP